MFIGQTLTTEVRAGTSFALLAALAGVTGAPRDELAPELADALRAVGDAEGETWLNLFGIPLDAAANTADELIRAVDAMDPVELRLHLLGRHAWSWCSLAGVDDIEAAAHGDTSAATRLLEHPRYYGGHARSSLATLLPLDPPETRNRIADAIAAGSRSLVDDATRRLAAAADTAESLLQARPASVAIEGLTNGYRYVPEPEAERVVLVPHLEPTLPLVLAQHRGARVIAYLAASEGSSEDRLLALGRALADPKRVEILALVGRGVGRAAELVEATALTRSTVHHHLAQLREAGLVTLEGNARAYTYVARREAADEAAALVADITRKGE
ncbi:MAG TPA: winged helix-turn-helix domain-containing protein [Gaiellaceae bacterium]|nr:winged helix-turn-helix domain-containing protein [Gaiellaceae bacterium]